MRKYVAAFDSATGMLRVLSRFLQGQDTPMLGEAPRVLEPALAALLGAANRLPKSVAERIYAASGEREAVPLKRIPDLRDEPLAQWIVDHYPKRRYPAVFIGSSNGALMHLAAALGVPWLPQTLLIPVRRRVTPGDTYEDLRLCRAAAERMLAGNPRLVLHHMHDANQDRLMVGGMAYFRVKWRALPEAYRAFLRDRLEPGGTVIVSECTQQWPVTRIADRYLFQHGALGGLDPEDYAARWEAPPPDGMAAEAEWGFEPELLNDLPAHAVRLRYPTPGHLSSVVADLYRDWYGRRGIPNGRLLGETFIQVEPWWALRTGSVPYWMVFSTEPSLHNLDAYLDTAEPYDEIRLRLFSHGVESEGYAPISAWRKVLERASRRGELTGVDERTFPRDFASLVSGHRSLAQVRPRYSMPEPLALDDAARFIAERPEVEWIPGEEPEDEGERDGDFAEEHTPSATDPPVAGPDDGVPDKSWEKPTEI